MVSEYISYNSEKLLKLKKLMKLKAGFSIVEAVLAAAVFGLIVTALVGALIYGEESTALAGARGRAQLLAEEGLEAARNMRDGAFANLTEGTHGLAISANKWVFSGTQDVSGVFTRQVTISSPDTKRKSVTATITWQQNSQRTGSVSLVTYLTNWLRSGIGNWGSPIEQSTLDLAGSADGVEIQVQGDYAYVIRNGGAVNFTIVNISNPASPVFTGFLNLSGIPTNIAVSGNFAYVSSQNNGGELAIVDISNPSSPVLSGSYNAPGNEDALGVFVNGTTVYLVRQSGADNNFLIINASLPSTPVLVGSISLSGNAREVTVLGSSAHVASESDTQELQVVNVGNPAAPTLQGTLDLSGADNAQTIDGFGSTIVLGRFSSGLYLINVATPSSPQLAGSLAVGTVNDISLGNSNAYAFLATSNSPKDFQVIDISNPVAPSTIGTFDYTAFLNGVAYDATRDRAVAVTPVNSEEVVIFAPQ